MINLFDLERAAEQQMELSAWGYFAGGSNGEVTLRENRAAWDRLAVRYRTMVDVSTRTLHTTVLGTRVEFPVLVAPTAMQKLAHPDGEVAMVRSRIEAEKEAYTLAHTTSLRPDAANAVLRESGSTPIPQATKLVDLARRQGVDLRRLFAAAGVGARIASSGDVGVGTGGAGGDRAGDLGASRFALA